MSVRIRIVLMCSVFAFMTGVAVAACANNKCQEIVAWEDDTNANNLKCYGVKQPVPAPPVPTKTCSDCPGTGTENYCNATQGGTCTPNAFAGITINQYNWAKCSSQCANVPNASVKETKTGGAVIDHTDTLESDCGSGS